MNKLGKNPVNAFEAPKRTKTSNYPEPFASKMSGRTKRPLGDLFGINKFGVNLAELSPRSESSILHKHSKQEEFIFVLSGNPTLILETRKIHLNAGDCFGFTPDGPAHKLINETDEVVTYIEIGDRPIDDLVTYPNDDLVAKLNNQGKWSFFKKNGDEYGSTP